MSTILEALKKSERDRKLNDVPTLSDMPLPEEKPSRMLIAFSVVVVLTLVWLVARYGFLSTQVDKEHSKKIILTTKDASSNVVEVDRQTGQENEAFVVSVVSYSVEPESRFAIVNGKLYRENEFVKAGLKVEKIEQDSVIFNLRGRRIVRKP
jgi:type II secretory pathway component PulC